MTFKQNAKIAMMKWSLADCQWVFDNSFPESKNKKLAAWTAKKKFNTDLTKSKSINNGTNP